MATTRDANRLCVGLEELAVMLSLGRTTTRELVRTGRIRSVRAGNKILVPMSAIREYLGETPETGSTDASADNS